MCRQEARTNCDVYVVDGVAENMQIVLLVRLQTGGLSNHCHVAACFCPVAACSPDVLGGLHP